MKFKMQAEQAPNYHRSVLIYNEDRSVMGELPMTTDMRSWFQKLEVEKIYFEGDYDPKTGNISVTDILEGQDW